MCFGEENSKVGCLKCTDNLKFTFSADILMKLMCMKKITTL